MTMAAMRADLASRGTGGPKTSLGSVLVFALQAVQARNTQVIAS